MEAMKEMKFDAKLGMGMMPELWIHA